jgi:hypothetical protein
MLVRPCSVASSALARRCPGTPVVIVPALVVLSVSDVVTVLAPRTSMPARYRKTRNHH